MLLNYKLYFKSVIVLSLPNIRSLLYFNVFKDSNNYGKLVFSVAIFAVKTTIIIVIKTKKRMGIHPSFILSIASFQG